MFIDGRLDRTLRGDGLVAEFIEILEDYVAQRFPAPEPVADGRDPRRASTSLGRAGPRLSRPRSRVYTSAQLNGRSVTWVTPTFLFERSPMTSAQRTEAIVSRDFVGALLQLNAEKQISREQLIGAVEDGIQSAYRRVAGDEDIHVRIDAETGKIRVFRARRVVGEIEDEFTEMTIDAGARHPTPDAERRRPGRDRAARRRRLRPDRRPDRQADRPPAHPRGRARPGLRPVRQPRGRAHHRHGQPGRAARDHPRRRQERRGDPGHDRAERARALPHRPERQGVRARGPSLDQGPADLRQPHPQGLPQAPVRARGPGDPQRHRRDQGHRPRGRQPLEGRRRRRARTGSTRSARPSASAAPASRPSWPSCRARRSTSSRGATTPACSWPTP